MPRNAFSHVTTWVFDLDNTLYPPEVALFDQINLRMTRYVAQALGVAPAEADRLRETYFRDHGTTLAGLMDIHGVDPAPYLLEVHDIDFSDLRPDPQLATAIEALPGRKIIYTNGTAHYARNVLAARGLSDHFDAIYGVEEANLRPKPERRAFEAVFARDGLDPQRAAMFEDDPRNLLVPHALGMRTVLVGAPKVGAHIDFACTDLAGFLAPLGADAI